MLAVFISDTHNQGSLRDLPEGDILIHCGDWTVRGTTPEIARFNADLGAIKHRYRLGILVVPGNHDWLAETNAALCREMLSNATLLNHEAVTIEGVKFFGSPFTPEFCNWAFNVPRGEKLKEKWDMIPLDTDVLITHGPPAGILDYFPEIDENTGEEGLKAVGCVDLYDAVTRIKPAVHAFGHVHFSNGLLKIGDTTFINSAICNENYRPVQNVHIFEISSSDINISKCMYKCKRCNVEKERIRSGTIGKKLNPKYVDELGNPWNGKECHACSKERNKLKKRSQRSAQ